MQKRFKHAHLLLLLAHIGLFFTLSACEAEDVQPSLEWRGVNRYLHISHIRSDTNGPVLPSLRSIDFAGYNMLWLGGDMAYGSSADDMTMDYLDASFDLGNKNTLWSLGNHDYSDLARIQRYTHRPNYFAYSRNGITVIVLDTQDSLCNIVRPQLAFFNSVVDTLQKSSHLIVLHHKLIWMPDNPMLESLIPTVSNIGMGPDFNSLNRNNFYSDLYPKLLDVHQRGIEVICVGGDMGKNDKQFAYETPEGIHFLGSGVSNLEPDEENKVLMFYHDVLSQKLTWSFVPVSNLQVHTP